MPEPAAKYADIPSNVARIAVYGLSSPEGDFPHVPIKVQRVEFAGESYEVWFRAVWTKDGRAWRWELLNRTVE